jgi:thiamine biosynthesis lipoprotein
MKHSTNLRLIISILLAVSLLLSACTPAHTTAKEITRSGFFFDTLINITIYNTDDKSLLDDSFDLCQKYDDLLSMTKESSDIARINRAGTNPVSVSSETMDILNAASEYYRLSDGKLDISVGGISSVWTQAREEQCLPDSSLIREALKHTGLDKITVDKDMMCVYKSDPETVVDLGALGKGYVADRIKEMLISRGVSSAIISLGGNIVTIGTKPGGKSFHIGVKKPFSADNEAVCDLSVWDKSVVTSGVYERYLAVDNRIYHHVLDPKTGYPAATDLMSATIISNSSLDGDALSTICLLYGLDDAMQLINKTPGTEAIFITWDNELHYTGGASYFVTN